MDVAGPAQREVDQPQANRVVGEPVDDDEAAKVAVVGVRRKRDLLVERQVANADLVEGQRSGGGVFKGVDVDLVLGSGELAGYGSGAELDEVGAPRKHFLVAHPQHLGFELVCHLHGCVCRTDHATAAGIYLVLKGDHDGLACDGGFKVAIHGDEALNAGLARRRQHFDLIAGPQCASGKRAGEAAEGAVWPAHPLHGQPGRSGGFI